MQSLNIFSVDKREGRLDVAGSPTGVPSIATAGGSGTKGAPESLGEGVRINEPWASSSSVNTGCWQANQTFVPGPIERPHHPFVEVRARARDQLGPSFGGGTGLLVGTGGRHDVERVRDRDDPAGQ